MPAETESRSVAKGRGIGFQINCIVAVSVVVVMAIILGIVGYMTFGTLEERAKAERFQELRSISAAV